MAAAKVGDIVQLRTTVIPDHNNHAVPDGTAVRFSVYYQGVEFPALYDATTLDGIAEVNLTVPTNRAGQMEVTAASGEAQARFRMQITVQENKQIIFVTVMPTSKPEPATATPSPTNTATPSPTATASPTPSPTPVPTGPVAWPDFLVLCLWLAVVMVGSYVVPVARAEPQQRLRLALSGGIGALVGYNAFALGGPGPIWILMLLGAVAGLAVGWFGFVNRGWGKPR